MTAEGAPQEGTDPPPPQTGDAEVDEVLIRMRAQLAVLPAENLPARRQVLDTAHRALRDLLEPGPG